jgi:hypothetical protein
MELARLPHQADLRVVACHYLEACQREKHMELNELV